MQRIHTIRRLPILTLQRHTNFYKRSSLITKNAFFHLKRPFTTTNVHQGASIPTVDYTNWDKVKKILKKLGRFGYKFALYSFGAILFAHALMYGTIKIAKHNPQMMDPLSPSFSPKFRDFSHLCEAYFRMGKLSWTFAYVYLNYKIHQLWYTYAPHQPQRSKKEMDNILEPVHAKNAQKLLDMFTSLGGCMY